MSTEEMDARMARVEERVKLNTHELEVMQGDISDIKKEQKAIYDLNSSVKLIAERMGQMKDKMDDTNTDVKTLHKEMASVKSQIAEVDVKADRQVAKNWNQIKVAIITALCTFLATGIIAAVIHFIN